MKHLSTLAALLITAASFAAPLTGAMAADAPAKLANGALVDAKGSGSRRRYSYTDLLELRVIKSLLDAGIKLENVNFGRIDAGTARQIILQKVRDAERDIIYKEYIGRKGQIIPQGQGIGRGHRRGACGGAPHHRGCSRCDWFDCFGGQQRSCRNGIGAELQWRNHQCPRPDWSIL